MLNGTTTGLGSNGQISGADHPSAPGSAHLVLSDGSGSVTIPGGAALLGGADYSRSGSDLVIHGQHGEEIVVRDYFATDHPPKLIASSGASLDGDVVARLAGPRAAGQLAQASGGQSDAATEMVGIGKVKSVKGEVTVKHPDGTTSVLKEGDVVYQDDVIETGADAAVGLVLADKSTFSLGAKGRMVLDEMIYDPNAGDGKSAIAVLSGTFSFVSGQIAKANPDGMQIKTPVATLGIRGTTGHGAVEGENTSVALVADPDGQVGEIIITNGAGISVLNQPLMMSTISGAFQPPSPPVFVPASSLSSLFGDSISSLPNPTNLAPADLPPAATQGTGPTPQNQPDPQQNQQQNTPLPGEQPQQQGDTATPPAQQTATTDGPQPPATTPAPTVNSNSSLSSTLDPTPSIDKLLGAVIGSKDPTAGPPQGTTKGSGISPTATPPSGITGPQNSNSGNSGKSPATHTPPQQTTDNSQTGTGTGTNTPTTPTVTVREGTVIDPYISGATVWLDSDNDGVQDVGEWSAVTGPSGYFVMTDSSGKSLSGVLRATGGTDAATGAPITWVLSAPAGSTVVTPLTTLVQSLVQSGKTQTEALATVQSVLGLSTSTNVLTMDPLSTLHSSPSNAEAAAVLRAGIAVSNLMAVGVAALKAAGATEAGAQAAMLNSISTLAGAGGASALTNALSGSSALTSLLMNASSTAGVTLDTNFQADLALALSSLNSFALNTANSLEEAAKAAKLAQSSMTSEIDTLGSNPTSLSTVSNYTTNLNASLSDVSVGQMTPTLSGTEGNDVFSASGIGGTVYYGKGGNDTITGTIYNDRLYGDDGNDLINGGAGDDTLYGGAGNDILYGNGGNNTFYGGAGNDTIHASGSQDTVVFDGTSYGNDTIDGGTALGLTLKYTAGGPDVTDITQSQDGFTYVDITYADGTSTRIENLSDLSVLTSIYDGNTDRTLTIGTDDSKDIVLGSNDADTLYITAEDRMVFGGGGDDEIFGSGGKDELHGGTGDDLLVGNGGNDMLYGGSGDDLLDGGWDDDTLTGGAGNDIFNISYGHDVVADFVRGQDKVDVRDYAALFIGEGKGTNITSFAALQSLMTQTADGDTLISFTDSGGEVSTMTIKGVVPSALTADDFLISAPSIAPQQGVQGSNVALTGLAISNGTEVTVSLTEDLEALALILNVGTTGVTVQYQDDGSLKISGTTEQINAALTQTETTGLVIRGLTGSAGGIQLSVTGGETSVGSLQVVNEELVEFTNTGGLLEDSGDWGKPPSPLSTGWINTGAATLSAGSTLKLDSAQIDTPDGVTLNGTLITTGDNTVVSGSSLTINGGGALWGYGVTTVSGALHLNSTLDAGGNTANDTLGSILGVGNTVIMEGDDFSIADRFNLQGSLILAGYLTVDFSGKTLTGGGVLGLDGSMTDVTVETADASFDGTLSVTQGTFAIQSGRTFSVGSAELHSGWGMPGRIEISGGGTLTLTDDELANSGYLRTVGSGTATINTLHGYNDSSHSLIEGGATTTILDFGTGSITAEGVVSVNSGSTLILKGDSFAMSTGDTELPAARLTGSGTLDGSLLSSFVLAGTIRPGDYVNTEAFPSIMNGTGTLGLKGDAWFTEDTLVEVRAGSTASDALTFDGGLHLAGTLRLTLTAAPLTPITFISATAGGLTDTLSGTFNLLDFRGINSGLLIDPAYNTTTKTLTLTAITTGISETTTGIAVPDYVWNHAGDGDFTISGADVVYGNDGNDVFRISSSDTSFHLLDGGDGVDTLKIAAGGTTLDLSNLIGRVQAMDAIDISDVNAGKLTILDAATVRSFNAGVNITEPIPVHSSANAISGDEDALFILGDTNDTLHMKDPTAWVSTGNRAYTVDGVTQMYRHYTADNGHTHLYVDADVVVDNLTYTHPNYSVSLPSAVSMVTDGTARLSVDTSGLASRSPSDLLSIRLSVSDGALYFLDDEQQEQEATAGWDVVLHDRTPAQIAEILQNLQYNASGTEPTRAVIITLTDEQGVSSATYTTVTASASTSYAWTGSGDGTSLHDAANWDAASLTEFDRLQINFGDGAPVLSSGQSLTVDSLLADGAGDPSSPNLSIQGHLTLNGSGAGSAILSGTLDLTGGELTVNGNENTGLSVNTNVTVSNGAATLSGTGFLSIAGAMTLSQATLNASIQALEVSDSSGDLYLTDSILNLTDTSALEVLANTGNDTLDAALTVSGSSTLSIDATASADISGNLVLTAGSTLAVTGSGALTFSHTNEGGRADILFRNGSTLDVSGYNAAHDHALTVTDATLSIGPNANSSATLTGDYSFGHNTVLKIGVQDDGTIRGNTYIIDGDADFRSANLLISFDPGLNTSGTVTALDLTGSMTSLWKDIYYNNLSSSQIFRPYIDGDDLKLDIVTSGITTGSLLSEDTAANYVYAETGADVFYVKGADVIFANDGDDLLYIRDQNGSNGPAFSFIDGGSGTNNLLLEVADGQYSLDAYAPWVQNIDAVTMNVGSSTEQIYISADSIRSILGDKSSSAYAPTDNALIINGAGEDYVNLISSGSGWTTGTTPELTGYTGYTSTDSAGVEVHIYVQNTVSVQQMMAS